MDFNSFYLHSKHDSVVVGLDLTVDGRKVGDPGLSLLGERTGVEVAGDL